MGTYVNGTASNGSGVPMPASVNGLEAAFSQHGSNFPYGEQPDGTFVVPVIPEREIAPKFQLHVSGLNMLSKCGVQFEKRYLRHLWTPASVSMAIGTAVDASVTADLDAKIQTGELLPDSDVKDIARDALSSEWEKGIQVSEEDQEDAITPSKDGAIDASADLAGLHRTELAPRLQPTAVQWPWVLDIEDLPIQLAGTIDIREGMRSIRDTKTSAKSPVKTLADTSMQLTMYGLAVMAHEGMIPDTVALDYLVRTPKRKETKLVQLESSRTVADLPPLVERIHAAHRSIQSGIFTPAPVEAWWCSSKFCSYYRTCKYAAHPVAVAMAGGAL